MWIQLLVLSLVIWFAWADEETEPDIVEYELDGNYQGNSSSQVAGDDVVFKRASSRLVTHDFREPAHLMNVAISDVAMAAEEDDMDDPPEDELERDGDSDPDSQV
jgi:hypothetical protein